MISMNVYTFRRTVVARALAVCLASLSHAVLADDVDDYNSLTPLWLKAHQSGNADLAKRYAQQMLPLAERALPCDVPLCYSRIGMALQAKGNYEEAVANYNSALETSVSLRPTNERDRQVMAAAYIDSLIGLGSCYDELANYEKAISYFKRGVRFNREVTKDAIQEAKAASLLANAYHHNNELEQAHAAYRDVVAMLERRYAVNDDQKATNGYVLGVTVQNWALMHTRAGRYDLSEPMLRRAMKLIAAHVGWESVETASAASALGNALLQQGRGDEAEPVLSYAWTTQRSRIGADHPHSLLTLNKLAHLYRDRGRPDKAVEMLQQVVAGHEKRLGPEHPQMVSSLSNLGTALVTWNRSAEAEPLFQRAVALAESKLGPQHVETARVKFMQANCLIASGKPEQAFGIAEELISLHEQLPLPASLIASAYSVRAMKLYESDKKLEQGMAELAKAIELHEAARWHSGGAERERAASFAEALGYYGQMVDWQAAAGDLKGAFRTMEMIKARTYLEEIKLKHLDLMARRPAAERERLARLEAELRAALTKAEQHYASLPDLGEKPSAEAVQQRREAAGEVHFAQRALYEQLTDVRRSSTAYQQLMARGPEAASLEAVQRSLLTEGELLLLYHFGRGTQVARSVEVRPDGAVLHELSVTDDVATALGVPPGPLQEAALTEVLVGGKESVLAALSNPRLATTKNAQLAALWKLLIPEKLREELTSGKVKRLVLVPAGALALLPFETLIVNRADDPNPEFLLDVGPPISYAPSATVLLNLASRETKKATAGREPILTVADPAYPQLDTSTAAARGDLSRTANERLRAGLARLPYTAQEATWLQSNYETNGLTVAKLIGRDATEASFRRLAPGRSTVHLACHGMVDQSYGNFFGALALTPGKPGDPADDGFLSMSEIYQLDLSSCELAILSACQTNYGPRQQGEGVWALSRGFFVAGSRRVVASNWVVDDKAAASLISYFASGAAKSGRDSQGPDYGTSLHAAKKWVRGQEKWSSPFYWSSFVLIGPK